MTPASCATVEILLLISTLGPSGAARSGVLLAVGLTGRGHRCRVVSGTDGALAAELRKAGVPIDILPARRRWPDRTRTRAFAEILQTRMPDLLHINNLSFDGPALARVADRRGIPIVWQVREDPASRRVRRLMRPLRRFASRIVAVSDEIYRRLKEDVHDPVIRAVPNGIEPGPSIDPAGARAECGLDEGVVWIGWLGRLVERKGALDFLEAMQGLRPASRSVRFVLAGGSGPGRDEVRYRQQIERYLEVRPGLRAGTLRVERPEALPRLMEALDILVVPSYWEGCSRVVLEGMRSGVALVAYASGGTPELLEEGQSGLLVKTGDRRALADAVQRLIADPDLARRLGEGARRRIEREFTLARHLDAMEGVFAEAARVR